MLLNLQNHFMLSVSLAEEGQGQGQEGPPLLLDCAYQGEQSSRKWGVENSQVLL